ncbi:MAG: ribonuclease PH [Albidovulum sp.]|nr:ribonuclease PH [Albidovulum sp.]MDE0307758.1 ribonuclease PH [Albidovulum sp.]MDE0532068.1 ribonuclease PH [Albidovulum sp.]
MRPSGRKNDELRPISLETGLSMYAEGSCRILFGRTDIICSASVEKRVPFFRRNTGLGWLTAEYGMLPRATSTRNKREAKAGIQTGRTQEIQRLIGRSLRACLDMAALGERQIIVDCDVLQADGGTRCAAISGGWVALRLAVDKLISAGDIFTDPVMGNIAAVSCGIFAGQPILDLEFAEDSEAAVDANFVMTGGGKLVEVQCTAESGTYSRDELDTLLGLAESGTAAIVAAQNSALNA